MISPEQFWLIAPFVLPALGSALGAVIVKLDQAIDESRVDTLATGFSFPRGEPFSKATIASGGRVVIVPTGGTVVLVGLDHKIKIQDFRPRIEGGREKFGATIFVDNVKLTPSLMSDNDKIQIAPGILATYKSPR